MQHHNRTTISVETRQGQFIAHTYKKYCEVTSLCLTPLPFNTSPMRSVLVWFGFQGGSCCRQPHWRWRSPLCRTREGTSWAAKAEKGRWGNVKKQANWFQNIKFFRGCKETNRAARLLGQSKVKIRWKTSQIGSEHFCENIQNIFLWAAPDWLRDVGSGNTGGQLWWSSLNQSYCHHPHVHQPPP